MPVSFEILHRLSTKSPWINDANRCIRKIAHFPQHTHPRQEVWNGGNVKRLRGEGLAKQGRALFCEGAVEPYSTSTGNLAADFAADAASGSQCRNHELIIGFNLGPRDLLRR